MPVEFLTEEQRQRYGTYTAEPSDAQLASYFYLDDTDRERIAPKRSLYNRLGFALQVCTTRFLSTFLVNPIIVPPAAVRYVAKQLGIDDDPAPLLTQYATAWQLREHSREIQQLYGYRDFSEQPDHFRLIRWLYTHAWLTAERPSVLFDLATKRLVDKKVLLPGVSVLERLVASVRDRAANHLWEKLARQPTAQQRFLLEDLLKIPEGTRQTRLDQFRRAPTYVSGPGLVKALRRVVDIRAIGASELDLSFVPAGRLKQMARHAATSRAAQIERMPDDRRIATLLAFASVFEATAQDEALDVFDRLMRSLWTRATRAGERERLRTLRDLDAAALQLREACVVLLDSTHTDQQVREKVYEHITQNALVQACALVGELARPAEDEQQYQHLLGRYTTVRTFLPTLFRSITLQSTPAGRPILEAVTFLSSIERRKNPPIDEAPHDVVPRGWRRYVVKREGKEEHIDRTAYTLCVVERLQEALRRHEVFVSPSERWSDPRAKLLQGTTWEAMRGQVCQTLGRSEKSAETISALHTELQTAYQQTVTNFATNTAVRLEQKDGQDQLVLTPLDRLEEPTSLLKLRRRVNQRLPLMDLPEVLLEMQAQTNFASAFTHVSDGNARVENLSLSICAVLIAEACNIGLTPVTNPANPALARDRLTWVQQNYIRSETLSRANVMLVDAQTKLTLAKAWGGGEVASADGLRFIVPVRTINAGYNSKYFGVGRGVTYYNFTSDQFSGFNAIVIPGTIRDSLYILEGLLEQQTGLNPVEIMADTAGYSDVVFGLFWLLGYQFSPRIADIGEARFWRMDTEAQYGVLNGLARNRINSNLITAHWDDMLRVAGSLKVGTVHATDVMRTLQGGGRPSALARAIGEVGRIAKTLYLLAYIDDESYRRKILTQLNRGEGRHAVARVIFHGQRGELRQRYREGQEDQLGALGLVLNAVILWNTTYMQDAIEALRTAGKEVIAPDIARLSPLTTQHINFSGKYHFDLPDNLSAGQHRSLREPEQPDEEL